MGATAIETRRFRFASEKASPKRTCTLGPAPCDALDDSELRCAAGSIAVAPQADLGAREDHSFSEILKHEAERRRGICHRVRAHDLVRMVGFGVGLGFPRISQCPWGGLFDMGMNHNEAVVRVVGRKYFLGEYCPVTAQCMKN